MRASVSIFPKKISYSDNRPNPEIPDEVFEVAIKLIEQKHGCELVRDKTGLYIVSYSTTGPGKQGEGWESWSPIYIARVETWSAGGIKLEELQEYVRSKRA